MKKTIILLSFIGFCSVGFSQTNIANNNNTNTVKAINVSFNNGSMKAVRVGEKIQTTMEGVVKYKKEYTPEYPQLMIDPEKLLITNDNATKNN